MKDNITDFPGYHVTKDGKVYSCLIQGGSNERGPWVLRKTYITKKGHERIVLHNSTGLHSTLVSRLVAMAYIPNPKNLPVVMHLDDKGSNNTVTNLKWGTYKENTRDSISKGRWIMPKHGKGLNSPRSILSNQPRKQRRILRLYQLGFNYKDIGIKVNIKPKVISRFISFRNSLE